MIHGYICFFSTFLSTTESATIVERPEQQQQSKNRTSAQLTHKSIPIRLGISRTWSSFKTFWFSKNLETCFLKLVVSWKRVDFWKIKKLKKSWENSWVEFQNKLISEKSKVENSWVWKRVDFEKIKSWKKQCCFSFGDFPNQLFLTLNKFWTPSDLCWLDYDDLIVGQLMSIVS